MLAGYPTFWGALLLCYGLAKISSAGPHCQTYRALLSTGMSFTSLGPRRRPLLPGCACVGLRRHNFLRVRRCWLARSEHVTVLARACIESLSLQKTFRRPVGDLYSMPDSTLTREGSHPP